MPYSKYIQTDLSTFVKVLLVFLTLFSASSIFAEDYLVDGINYALEGSSLKVIKHPDGYKGEVVIPSQVTIDSKGTYTVVKIEEINGKGMTSLTIPTTVTDITVENIYDNIPEDLYAPNLNYDSDFTDIIVVSGNKNYASYEGNLYTQDQGYLLRVPNGKKSFKWSTKVYRIESKAFLYSMAQEISIPNVNIYSNNFAFCYNLETLIFPDTLREVGNIIGYCPNLKKIIFPTAVEYFLPSKSYKDNFIDFISHIGINKFNCPQILDYDFNGTSPNYSSLDGVVLNSDQRVIVAFPLGRRSYEVPEQITEFQKNSFEFCNLSSLTISENLVECTGAFGSDFYIDKCKCYRSTPPIGIAEMMVNGCKLYVPSEFLNTYKQSTYLSQYEDNIFPLDDWTDEPNLPVLLGDANGNGEITVADVVTIIKYYYNQETDAFILKNADVNEDNMVDLNDIDLLVDSILSFPESLSITESKKMLPSQATVRKSKSGKDMQILRFENLQ